MTEFVQHGNTVVNASEVVRHNVLANNSETLLRKDPPAKSATLALTSGVVRYSPMPKTAKSHQEWTAGTVSKLQPSP
jgi:hypothetical protein